MAGILAFCFAHLSQLAGHYAEVVIVISVFLVGTFLDYRSSVSFLWLLNKILTRKQKCIINDSFHGVVLETVSNDEAVRVWVSSVRADVLHTDGGWA